MTLRSQKSVNNNMAYRYGLSDSSSDGNSTDSEVAGYRFQPQRQRSVLSDRPDVRGREDPREIEMTRRETTRDGIDWCRCGKCRVELLVRRHEYGCCQETAATRQHAEPAGEGNYY